MDSQGLLQVDTGEGEAAEHWGKNGQENSYEELRRERGLYRDPNWLKGRWTNLLEREQSPKDIYIVERWYTAGLGY